MIEWRNKDIEYYTDLLGSNTHFSLACFGDAEWFSIINYRIGKRTGLGQILCDATGNKLGDIIVRRQYDAFFFLSTPDCFWSEMRFLSSGIDRKIDAWLKSNDVNPIFYEREIMSDGPAKRGKLYPFIKQLQKMSVRIIGNKDHRKINFLNYDHFTEISCPNCHLEPSGVENAVQDVLDYGNPGVYLVSAGMSAPLIIDQLHDKISNSWFIDCGSIWDAFVGIGRQRGWRAAIYKNTKKYQEWLDASLGGTPLPEDWLGKL